MEHLTERLEIRMHSDMMDLLRKEARRQNVPVAQIVRQAIEVFLKESRQSQMEASQALFQTNAPVSDWDEMKREIEEAELKDRSLSDRLEQLAQENAQTTDQVLETVVQDYLDRLEKEFIHRETEHFWSVHDELAAQYPGESVAMVRGQVVDHDADGSKLEIRVRQQYGSRPIFIAPVRAGSRRDLIWRGGHLDHRRAVE